MKKLKVAAIFLAICSIGALVTGCGLFSDNGASEEQANSSASFFESSSVESDSTSSGSGVTDPSDSSSDSDVAEPPVEDVNTVASLDIMNYWSTDAGKMSFITAEAFSGITQITFDARTGDACSWWGLAITKDPETASAYNTDLSLGAEVTNGEWVTYSFVFGENGCTITSTAGFTKTVTEWEKVSYTANEEFYVYFIGARGEAFSENILIDNFTIYTSEGTYTDDFEKGASGNMFLVEDARAVSTTDVEYEVEGSFPDDPVIPDKPVDQEGTKPSRNEGTNKNPGYVASLDIQNFWGPDTGSMSFITKEAYTGIRSITFDAWTGNTVSWWGIALTETPATASNYNVELQLGKESTKGVWVTYTYTFSGSGCTITSTNGMLNEVTELVTVPYSANKSYYVYFIGARGETFSDNVLIDNVRIVTTDGEYTDNFDLGVNGGLFDVKDFRAVSLDHIEETGTGKGNVAALDIMNFWGSDTGKMSFITKEAYAGLKRISFDAKTGDTVSWWGLAVSKDTTTASNYNTDLSLGANATKDVWVTYTFEFDGKGCIITSTGGFSKEVTELTKVPYFESEAYYVYFIGARGETFSDKIYIDNFTIETVDGETFTDDFEKGVNQNMFDVADSRAVVLYNDGGTEGEEITPILPDYPESAEGNALGIIGNKIGGNALIALVTKEAYTGITEISFNAKTTENLVTDRWSVALTTEKGTYSAYAAGLGVELKMDAGVWYTYKYVVENGKCIVSYKAENETEYTVLKEVEWREGTYYIYIQICPGSGINVALPVVYLDNFKIVAEGSTHFAYFDKSATDEIFEEGTTSNALILESVDGAPVYISDDRIDFTAYAPPTVMNWGSGTSNPNLITAEQYRYLAEAGFTKALALYEGRVGNSGLTTNEKAEKDALAALEYAEVYGIEYYVLNEDFYNFVRPDINIEFFDLTYKDGKYYDEKGNQITDSVYNHLKDNWMELYEAKIAEMFGEDNKYIDSPAYGGNFASDEPGVPNKVNGEWSYAELEQIYYQVKIFAEYIEKNGIDGGEAYVNLLPYGGVNAGTRARYDAMLDYYFKNIAPILGYVSFDHYPLDYSDSAESEINETHLLNLEMIANYCKEYDVELRAFVWSRTSEESSTGHRGVTGANDLRFQVYSNLAFGVKEMTYYMYTNYYTIGQGSGDTLIDCQTGQRTDAYYWAKEINNEVHALEAAYLNFVWENVMYFDVGETNEQLSLLETNVTSHERIASLTSSADILVGNFSDEDGEQGATDGFMVVNYTDPYDVEEGATDEVTITFNNATRAIVYQGGVRTVVTLENGACTLNLQTGEGVFVIPLN